MAVPLSTARTTRYNSRQRCRGDDAAWSTTSRSFSGAGIGARGRTSHAVAITKYAVGCASGTDACCFRSAPWTSGAGDEFLTTPLRSRDRWHRAQRRARPCSSTFDPRTYNLRPDLAAAASTRVPRLSFPSTCFGQVRQWRKYSGLAPRVPLIGGRGQSIGARPVSARRLLIAGEATLMGTFSFFPSKESRRLTATAA